MSGNRERNGGGFLGFIIRQVIVSLIHSIIYSIMFFFTVDLYNYLKRRNYSSISIFFIMLLCSFLFIMTFMSVLYFVFSCLGYDLNNILVPVHYYY